MIEKIKRQEKSTHGVAPRTTRVGSYHMIAFPTTLLE